MLLTRKQLINIGTQLYNSKVILVLLTLFVLALQIFSVLQSTLPKVTYAAPTSDRNVYVDPATGDDSTGLGTISSPVKTLPKARDIMRQNLSSGNMTKDYYVYLRGGIHTVDGTFELNQADSGKDGYQVIYQSFDSNSAVINGGKKLSSWTLFDSTKNIFRAQLGTIGTGAGQIPNYPRQFFMNGERLQRAWSGLNPSYITTNAVGSANGTTMTTTDNNMQNWGNITDMEYTNTMAWRVNKCGVESITGNNIVIDQQCANNSARNYGNIYTGSSYSYLSNAYELIDTAKEWYYNRADGYVYYMGSTSDTTSTLGNRLFVVPIVEKLVSITGTSANNVKNIKFDKINFEYGAWSKPNSTSGYSANQGGVETDGTLTPGQVTTKYAQNISFTNNLFAHLGSAGLQMDDGTTGVRDSTTGVSGSLISGNKFVDLSGASMIIGSIRADSFGTDEVKNIDVSNNYISNVANEYLDNCGLTTIYANNIKIVANEIEGVPYSGICISRSFMVNYATTSHDNYVAKNKVYDFMKILADGGGIYSLGWQPGTKVFQNYTYNPYHPFGNLYADEGSRDTVWEGNVVKAYNGSVNFTNNWIMMMVNGNHRDNIIKDNYRDTNKYNNQSNYDNGTYGNNLQFINNDYVAPGQSNSAWPTAAQNIMNGSGIQPAATATAVKAITDSSATLLSYLFRNPAVPSLYNYTVPSTANSCFLSFTPVADAFVISGSNGNYSGNTLNSGGTSSSQRLPYLKFNVTGVGSTALTSLKLRLKEAPGGSADRPLTFNVKTTGTNWLESNTPGQTDGITYNTRPTANSTVQGTYSGTPYEGQIIDVSLSPSMITGDGTYSIVLEPIINSVGENIDFGSREANPDLRPQLVTSIPTGNCNGASSSSASNAISSVASSASSSTAVSQACSNTTTQTSTFSATADSYVKEANPTINYGTAANINFGTPTGNQRISYLKFDVAGVTDPSSIKLKLKEATTGGAPSGTFNFAVRKTQSNTWTETGTNSITWNNKPLSESANLGNFSNSVSNDQIIEVPINPSLLTGDGTYSLTLFGTDGSDADFVSKEGSSTDSAKLVVTSNSTTCVNSSPNTSSTPISAQNSSAISTNSLANNSSCAITTTLQILSDAGVKQASPSSNFGSAESFNVGGATNSNRRGYLSFDTTSIVGTITSANLVIKEAPTGTANGINFDLNIQKAIANFSESAVTWNTKPNLDGINYGLFSDTIEQDQILSIPISTSFFGVKGIHNMGLISSETSDIDFVSREGLSTDAPKLVITSNPTTCVNSSSSINSSTISSQNSSAISTNSSTSNSTGTNPTILSLRMNLGSSYNKSTNKMNTNLRDKALLPSNQPYNYSGTESVANINSLVSSSDIVDWILIDVRESANTNVSVVKKAALLRSDGMVVDPSFITAAGNTVNYSTGVKLDANFGSNSPNLYKIVISHKGSISIITNPISITANATTSTLDLTTLSGNNSVKGNNQLRLNPNDSTNPAVFGLYFGDVNNDQSIDAADRNAIRYVPEQTNIYTPSDINLDGSIDAKDRTISRLTQDSTTII